MAVAAVAGIWLLLSDRSPEGGETLGDAPAFTLASTDGRQVSLSDYRGRNVLLYFNEGVGCDPCFTQMLELEQNGDALAREGLTVLPIVVNPLPDVVREVMRFGLQTPFLIDDGARVSQAYDMLGRGMHANLPGHGFVLIDGSGRIRWRMEYPSMYVSTQDLLSALEPSLSEA